MNTTPPVETQGTRIPLLDLTRLRHPDIDVRRKLGRELAELCRTVGFFYIVNHGVDVAKIDGMFYQAKRFFALPEHEKVALSMTSNPHWRGYLPMRMLGNDAEMKGNMLESFHVWQEHADDDPGLLANKPLHARNIWPAALPGLRPAALAYVAEVTELAKQMMRLAALGLDLPEDTFVRYFTNPISLLRLIHYPPQQPADPADIYGTRPHTDNGAFTLLAQDQTGGLEIMGPDGDWLPVPPVAGSFVINLGEMMKVWTNGLFRATPHRVINKFGKDRYSSPFFLNPDYDHVVAPVMHGEAGAVEPVFHTTVGRDEAATCGEILTRLYRRIWPSALEGQVK